MELLGGPASARRREPAARQRARRGESAGGRREAAAEAARGPVASVGLAVAARAGWRPPRITCWCAVATRLIDAYMAFGIHEYLNLS